MVDTLKLKSLMLLNGFKQEDIAKLLNISLQAFNMKINNKRDFRLSEILKLCEILKIETAQEKMSIFFANQVDLNLQNE